MGTITTAEALRTVAVTVDTALENIEWKIAKQQSYIDGARKALARAVKADIDSQIARREEELQEELDKMAELEAEAAPLYRIYNAAPWTRYIYVPNGHVHAGTYCSTLRPTTQIMRLAEYSGSTREQLVEAAGEVACTVCFPDAPVNKPTTIGVYVKEREEREAEAAAKAEAKAAADAQKIAFAGGTFKTLRAAENAISWEMETFVSRSYQEGVDEAHTQHLRNLAAEDRATIETIADAIITVHPEWDRAGVLAKKFDAKAKVFRKAGYTIPADASY
ncbi:hypothetical protein SEA_MUFASA8_35 [Arthrobacter phage Mufasa8]|uniref:Uncharacterized protein n=1 Tax=Arthrobacter phage Mufasa8 TaxID=2656526 RepID=A0A649VMS5_9CAUD|nr:hypothetical protein HYQ08_gp035 [Arthrobacter phage Mufasa8]QGJ93484.1 hypothetical protein SEA_MUFASA8_35 [Arthrobacter phage Mufasa8]